MKVELATIAGIAKAIFLLIVGGFISRRFEKRAKLVSFFGHVSAFNHTLPDGVVINVYSHSVVIRNSGSGNATNVRIHRTTLPVLEFGQKCLIRSKLYQMAREIL